MCALAAACGSVPDILPREPVVKLFRALFSPLWSRFIRAPAGAGTVRSLVPGMLAMAGLVVLSNYLVRFPVNDFLTWGAFSYPFVFLVTDLTNRVLGPAAARRVVYWGFACGVGLSLIVLPGFRIAVASGVAFLAGQLLDVAVFDRLRRRAHWWLAPAFSSFVGSTVDSFLFFSLAFAGTSVPFVTLALGDWGVKLGLLFICLPIYRGLSVRLRHRPSCP